MKCSTSVHGKIAEFEGRYNSCPLDTTEQMRIMARGADGKRMTYAELID